MSLNYKDKKIIDDELIVKEKAENRPCELVICGNTAHLKNSDLVNNTCRIVKLDKDTYVKSKNLNFMSSDLIQKYINKSGELGYTFKENYDGSIDINGYLGTLTLCHFNHHETRVDDTRSIRRSIGELRDLINTNVLNGSNCRFVTLTYKENMTDSKKLIVDFHHFNERLRDFHKIAHLPDYEYIKVKEPQKRGAWHLHVLLIYKCKAPFIANSVISDCWKKGYVKITAVDNVDNVGAYLSAYLCNDYVDDIECSDKSKAHKIEKGKRLTYYKKGERFFSYSKGIKKPLIKKMAHSDALSYLYSNGYHLTFQKDRSIEIKDIDSTFDILTQYFQRFDDFDDTTCEAVNNNTTAVSKADMLIGCVEHSSDTYDYGFVEPDYVIDTIVNRHEYGDSLPQWLYDELPF